MFLVFKHEFLGASRSYFYFLLLFFFLTLHEISLYFTLITQNLYLSLFPFKKFRNWLIITRYNSCLFGMKFISCLFIYCLLTYLHNLPRSCYNLIYTAEFRSKKMHKLFSIHKSLVSFSYSMVVSVRIFLNFLTKALCHHKHTTFLENHQD